MSIRLMIVDDQAEARRHIEVLASLEPDMEVVGSAASGEEALAVLEQGRPEVAVVDVSLPGMNGFEVCEQLANSCRRLSVILVSVASGPDPIRRAMLAGAREFVQKPFDPAELFRAVRVAAARLPYATVAVTPLAPQRPLIAVWSLRGGVGRTTLAANLAVSLGRRLERPPLLMDGHLRLGDIGLLFDVPAQQRGLEELLAFEDDGDLASLLSTVAHHTAHGCEVLIAPQRPEEADRIAAPALLRLLAGLRRHYPLVLIDLPASLDEITLSVLESASLVLLPGPLSLSAMRAFRTALGVGDVLGLPRDQLWLVRTRVSDLDHIAAAAVPRLLHQDFVCQLPDEPRHRRAEDAGTPLTVSQPGAPYALGLQNLAERIIEKLGLGAPLTRPSAWLASSPLAHS